MGRGREVNWGEGAKKYLKWNELNEITGDNAD